MRTLFFLFTCLASLSSLASSSPNDIYPAYNLQVTDQETLAVPRCVLSNGEKLTFTILKSKIEAIDNTKAKNSREYRNAKSSFMMNTARAPAELLDDGSIKIYAFYLAENSSRLEQKEGRPYFIIRNGELKFNDDSVGVKEAHMGRCF